LSWVRIGDEFAEHAKVAPLSDAALRLWLIASCWSRKPQNLRHEGRIPAALLVTIGQNRWPASKARKLAAELVAANAGGLYEQGLWVECDGGWQIHDWRQYGAVVQEPGSLSATRSEAGRKGAAARWQTDGKGDGKRIATGCGANGDGDGKSMPPNPIPIPNPNQPEPTTQRPAKSEPQSAVMPVAVVVDSESKIPCPPDLVLLPGQIGQLEQNLGIKPGEVDRLTAELRAGWLGDSKRMPLESWRRYLLRAISGRWNNPNTRPQKPSEPTAPAKAPAWKPPPLPPDVPASEVPPNPVERPREYAVWCTARGISPDTGEAVANG